MAIEISNLKNERCFSKSLHPFTLCLCLGLVLLLGECDVSASAKRGGGRLDQSSGV